MKRWILVLMFLAAAGGGVTPGGDDRPQPEPDIYGGPPICC